MSENELSAPGEKPHRPPVKMPGSGAAEESAAAQSLSAASSGERSSVIGAPSPSAPTKVVLWGAPGSGKTTFLAALRLAAEAGDNAVGRWTIYPNNPATAELLARSAHQLVVEQRFPDPTPPGEISSVSVTFVGDLARSKFAPRRWFWRRGPVTSNFELDLVDFSGEAFSDRPDDLQVPEFIAARSIDDMASAQGLIYLFDPVTELQARNSAQYVNRTLVELSQRMMRQRSGRFLPQHLSICITKFDHPDVFLKARQLGLVDENFRVPDHEAERFFDMYCDGLFSPGDERSAASTQFVRNELRNRFDPSHIRYFVTSSIGLHHRGANAQAPGASAIRDAGDFANVRYQDGMLVIRGPIEPINVLEPLISLQRRITAHGENRPK